MLTIDPKNTPTAELHQYMLGAVAPRPIAFVSTISGDGIPNLAPYSFFNAYSSRPPVLVFSSNRRVRDNTTKDTLSNVEDTREVVINIVNYDMVYQMALASVEYGREIDEFAKSGLTPIASDIVKPFRVKESPVQIECIVQRVIPLGNAGGAGNLIICEIVRMHISQHILDEKGHISPYKTDQMARMGKNYYCRVVPQSIMSIHQPVEKMGMGVDALPDDIRLSSVLTGNDLARLAAEIALPSTENIAQLAQIDTQLSQLLTAPKSNEQQTAIHQYAQKLIAQNQIEQAWIALLAQPNSKKH